MWVKFLSTMIVPFNCSLSLELSVSSVLAHTLWTAGRIYRIFMSLSVKQTQLIPHRLFPAFVTIVGNMTVSKQHHSSLHPAVCLYNSPLSALLFKCSLTIPFPTQCSTDILDHLHNHQWSSQFSAACVWNIRYELSGTSLELKLRYCRKCTLLFRSSAISYWHIDIKYTTIVEKLCTLCSTKIKRHAIWYVLLRQWGEVQFPS